jgi:hypothetical protein
MRFALWVVRFVTVSLRAIPPSRTLERLPPLALMRSQALARAALAVLLIAAACTAATDNGGDGGGDVHLTSIVVSGVSGNLAIGDSVDLVATGHYSDGSSKIVTDSASWSSDHTGSVTVGNTAGTRGRAIWAGGGTAMITASYLGQQGMATISAIGINSLEMSPSASTTVDSAGTRQITATAHLSDASTLDVTSLAGWTSIDANIATVNNGANKGRVTGVSRGSTTIIAGWHGVLGQVTVTTLAIDSVAIHMNGGPIIGGYFPIGGTLTVTAQAYYSNSSQTDISDSAAWTSSTSAMTVAAGVVSRVGSDSSFVQAKYKGAKGKALLHKGCDVLASGLSFDTFDGGPGVGYLKVDGGGVVWFDYDPAQPASGGAFRTVAAGGGTVATIRSSLPYVGEWDMDASYIYWMWVDSQGAQSYYIVRMSRSSGAVDTLHSNVGLGGGARGLAVDGSYIYYAPGDAGGVRRMAKGGGGATSFFAGSSFYPRWMALSAGTVYGVDWDNAQIKVRALPTNGSPMDTLANASGSLYSIVNGGYLYWYESNPGNRIARVSLGGGTVESVVPGPNSTGFAITGGYLYFGMTSIGASIARIPVAGGIADVVSDACGYSANQGVKPLFFATDGTYIYLSDYADGTGHGRILRVRK